MSFIGDFSQCDDDNPSNDKKNSECLEITPNDNSMFNK